MRKRTEYFFEKCLANTMFSDAEVKVGQECLNVYYGSVFLKTEVD